MNKKHAFIGLVVVCLLVCALVWAWQAREDKKVSSMPLQAGLEESFRDLKVEIARRFAEAADLLNKDAPKTLQPGIVMKRVEVGEGPSMTYHYVLENGAVELDTAPVIERTCSVPEMRDYMQYGVFYTYVYEDGGRAGEGDYVSYRRRGCLRGAREGEGQKGCEHDRPRGPGTMMRRKSEGTTFFELDIDNPPRLTPKQKAELEALAAMPEGAIDYSDIPPVEDFGGFRRAGTKQKVP